jgi:hypothetical protein
LNVVRFGFEETSGKLADQAAFAIGEAGGASVLASRSMICQYSLESIKSLHPGIFHSSHCATQSYFGRRLAGTLAPPASLNIVPFGFEETLGKLTGQAAFAIE